MITVSDAEVEQPYGSPMTSRVAVKGVGCCSETSMANVPCPLEMVPGLTFHTYLSVGRSSAFFVLTSAVNLYGSPGGGKPEGPETVI